jgi:rhodanese-related sulfurtransferase
MEIKVNELKEKLNNNILLLDVRTAAEFQGCHVKGAVNLPLDALSKEKVQSLAAGKDQIITICQGGKRGSVACSKLAEMGFAGVVNVIGGTNECKTSGFALVESDRKVISLERQVRIAAGALVLLGVILANCCGPNWIYLSAFVGAGLMFAGITDTCGMAMFLAKMPWNKGSKNKGACCL